MGGKVLAPFEVPSLAGKPKTYRVGQVCNSLRDLLWLLRNEVATDTLRADLDEQSQHLAAFSNEKQGGFQVIYQSRNDLKDSSPYINPWSYYPPYR